MDEYILFVFEGAKTEKQIYDSLKRNFSNEFGNAILTVAYCSNIYSLYQKVQADTDLDLLPLLQQRPENQGVIDNILRDQISEIFLFFDYDGHDPIATDDKLYEMLLHFSEETETGKLYISYPMVEAIKHLKQDVDFKDIVVESCKTYKKLVSENCDKHYIDLTKINKTQWIIIIHEHCKKLNYLMEDVFIFPTRYISQQEILLVQSLKHISKNNQVAVLSAFPIFLLDYYGHRRLPTLLEDNHIESDKHDINL